MKFGTDGIRGRAGEPPIDAASAVRIGAAALALAREAGGARVLIARDTRPSGSELAAACASGVVEAGGRAVDLGVLPTPGLAVALAQGLGEVGVMITASHNPWSDNGFKLLGPGGRKPDASTTTRIEAWLEDPPAASGEVGARSSEAAAALTGWTDAVRARVDPGRFAGRRLAFDPAGGAVRVGLDWLRSAIPAEWVIVPGERINDGVGSEHPEALARVVRERGCDAGIAVDGDGDRCVLVDERGEVVEGDALAWLLARALGVDRMAVTVMSNGALAPALPGVELTVTPVGDKHLQAAMSDHGIPLGCEESGHVLFADHPGGDGLLAGLRALQGIDGPLSAAIAPFVPWPRVKARCEVRSRPPLDGVPPIREAIRDGEAALGAGGRVFLRYSGTEPVLRILVEGRDRDVVRAVAARVEATVRACL